MQETRKTKNPLWMMVIVAAFITIFSFQQDAFPQEKAAQFPAIVEKERSFGVSGIGEKPLSLKSCLAKALKDNPLVSEAQLSVDAGQKAVESARGKHFPKVSLDANYTQRQDPWPYIPAQSATLGPHFSDEFASWNVIMTLPIYQGGQTAAGVELAKIRKSIQEENLSLTKNEVIANTVNTYNKILQLRKFREAVVVSVTALDSQRKNSQWMYDLGRVAKVDLLKVEVGLANEKQRLLSIDEGLTNLVSTLHFLMGEQIAGTASVPLLSDELALPKVSVDFNQGLAMAQKKRPEYRMAIGSLEEAETNTKIATGKLLPSLGAFAGFMDQYGFNPSYQEANWYAGINLTMTLFEKSSYDEIAKERIMKAKAEKRLTFVENQIRLDIQNALSSLKESKNRVLTAQRAVEQAEEAFRIEQKKYESGAGTTVDLLYSQASHMTAVANYTQALFDYNSALVAYRKVTGTLEEYLQ